MRTEETRRILVEFFGHGLRHPEPNQYDIIISPSQRAKHEQTDLIIEEARGIREMVIVVNRSSGVDYEEKGEPARTAANVHEIGEFLEGALLELTDENTWACIKEIWFGEDRYETEVDVYDDVDDYASSPTQIEHPTGSLTVISSSPQLWMPWLHRDQILN